MQKAYGIAMENMKKAAAKGQRNYNRRAWSSVLEPGDHVLERNLSERGGPGKLRAYWEKQTYVVKGRRGWPSVCSSTTEWDWKVKSATPQPSITLSLPGR